jgi:hypothetical protein
MTGPRNASKGDRAQIMARPHRIVYDIVKREAAELGISMGQYVADVLAHYVGHPELVRELDGLLLQYDPVDDAPRAQAAGTYGFFWL